jgi:hypothetical protein
MARSTPLGVHVQSYIDAVPGATESAKVDNFTRGCEMMKASAVSSVFVHQFPHALSGFDDYANAAERSGLQHGGALGLDSSAISPEDKGDAIADVATRRNSLGCLADSESHFDPGRRDEMRRMGAQARKGAPDALIVAQPWPEPNEHGQFPYEEEDAFCDADAPQYYVNDWIKQYGRARYAKLLPVFDAQWTKLRATVLAKYDRAFVPTWQGRAWDDIPADCGEVVITRPSLIVWCEPFPSTLFLRQCRARAFLAARGFIKPDWTDATTAVLRFQQDYNKTATTKLTEDGRCGLLTLSAMGV